MLEENKNQKVNNKKKIKSLISSPNVLDHFILDDQNVIVIVNSNKRSIYSDYYMIHKRLENGKFTEIFKYPLESYTFNDKDVLPVISEVGLFKVPNKGGISNCIYDYKNGKMIISKDTWDYLEFGLNNSLLEKYNCIFASLTISSDFINGDSYTYVSPLNGKTVVESFKVVDGTYFAILNPDGTIRGNKLFKGDSLSKVDKIIDLKHYKSLDDFKNQRKKLCNDRKNREKQKYFKQLNESDNKSMSSCFSNDVIKVLNLKK